MSLIEIHVYQNFIDEKVADVESKVSRLQELYDLLSNLGVDAISMNDLKSVVENAGSSSFATQLKGLVSRGKNLSIGGVQIDSSIIVLDPNKVREIQLTANKLDPGRRIHYQFYTITDDVVATIENIEDEFKESCTVYGTAKTQEVLDDIDALCISINSILSKIGGIHPQHPLLPIDTWVSWDSVTKQYSPIIHNIARHVK
jgi:hypothetical protein